MATSIDRITQYIMREHNISDRRVAEQMAREGERRVAEQQRYAQRREEALNTPYHDWLKREFPEMDWDSPVYVKIIEYVQAVLDGEITQLIINIPPRTGKSNLVTIRLPVFWLLRYPTNKVIIGAYNKDLAKNFSEESLKIYQEITPLTVESSLADEWSTIYGGMVKAIGVGSSVAGFGADCLTAETLIDTIAGPVSIEDLCAYKSPPLVLSYNQKLRKPEYKDILATREVKTETLCRVSLSDGSFFACTPEHRIFLPAIGVYMPAMWLQKGFELLRTDGRTETVESILVTEETDRVFDLQIEDNQNFFANGILVHNCLIADDPIKSYAEAHSPTYQTMVWNWWLNDLRTRRNRLSQTPTILIHTRWTEEDLTGRILSSATASQWTVLTIPAISIEDDPQKDALGRHKGESILPSRLPIQDLITIENEMGRDFQGLYQQNPKSEASYTIKTQRIEVVEEVPVAADRVRYFDRAGSEGKGDWTVGVLMAIDDNGFVYIEDVLRGQWAPEDVEKQIEQTIKLDAYKYAGKSRRMMQFWIEQEPAASGKQVAYATQRKLAGYEVMIDRPGDNKDVRSRPFSAYVNAGNVRMKRAEWNAAYIKELSLYIAFGKREHDDQVDASSGAYTKLTIERMVVESR